MAHYLKSPPSEQEPRQRSWAVVKRGMFLGTVKALDRAAAKAAAAQRFGLTDGQRRRLVVTEMR